MLIMNMLDWYYRHSGRRSVRPHPCPLNGISMGACIHSPILLSRIAVTVLLVAFGAMEETHSFTFPLVEIYLNP